MMRSLFAGVAGLQNHQTQMDVIGNNIANVNTIGYKGGRVTFQDTLSQMLRGASAPSSTRGGINAIQVGLGMNLASIDILQTQGNLQNTGTMTDVALQGDGFFIVGNGSQQYFTRAGNFQLEENGRLDFPSNGLMLQGWMANGSGVINSNTPVTGIQLPIGKTIAPVATTEIGFKGTIDSQTNGTLSYPTLNISDGLGNNPTVEIQLTAVGFNQYQYTAKVTNGTITSGAGSNTGIIALDTNGNVIGTGTDFVVTPTGAGAKPITIHVPQVGEANGGSFVSDKVGTGSVALTGFNPSFVSSTGTLTGFTGAGTYNVNTTDGNGNAVTLQYTVVADGVTPNQYNYTLSATGANVTGGATGSFIYDGSDTTSWSGPMTVRSTANIDIAITPPGTVPGVPQFAITSPQTFTKSVTDNSGNSVTLTYTVTAGPAANQYNYSIAAAGGSVVSGGSGTFTYTSASGTSNGVITGGLDRTIVSSAAGLQIALAPPSTAPGVPAFSIMAKEGPFAGTFTSADPLTTTTKVYDSLGAEHTFTTTVTKSSNNFWTWACVDEAGNAIGNGTLSFSDKGQLVTSTGGPLIYQPVGANPMSVTPDFSNVYQYKTTVSEITSPDQDGFPMGQLQTFNIDKSGKVVGVFSNGMSQTLAQIAVANFSNPSGLMRTGESMFQESANSGTAQIGQAGQNGRGSITPGAVEMSNVNLSQEFTQMIVTERGFQANSKIITTSDEMLQDLVNLKR